MRSAALLVVPLLTYSLYGQDPAGVLSQFAVARFAGTGNVTIQAMTSDAAGNIYVAATTTAADLPALNASRGSDVYVAKLAPGGTATLWSAYLGGSSTERAVGIAVDAQGDVIVAGNTASGDFRPESVSQGNRMALSLATTRRERCCPRWCLEALIPSR